MIHPISLFEKNFLLGLHCPLAHHELPWHERCLTKWTSLKNSYSLQFNLILYSALIHRGNFLLSSSHLRLSCYCSHSPLWIAWWMRSSLDWKGYYINLPQPSFHSRFYSYHFAELYRLISTSSSVFGICDFTSPTL